MPMRTIDCNFKIPKRYQKLFTLVIGDFKYVIIVEGGKIHSGQIGETKPEYDNDVLDFIAGSICRVRHDCGADD